MTRVGTRQPERGFTLFELAVSLSIVAVLAGLLITRVLQYRGEAERHAVQQTVALLRVALDVRIAGASGPGRRAWLAHVAEENPFDWLKQKPDNYLGEYYSPDVEKMPTGNWVFDRRDKSLIYLLSSHKSFSFGASNFLKFKVEFAQARTSGVKYGPAEVPISLVIEQSDDSADSID